MDGELITKEKKRKMRSEISIENAGFEVSLFARSGPQIVLVPIQSFLMNAKTKKTFAMMNVSIFL